VAKVAGSTLRVYYDEFNVSGYVRPGSVSLSQQTPVVTTLSDAGPRRVVDNYAHSHEDTGFFDGADDAYDEIVRVALATDEDHHRGEFPDGTTDNNVAHEYVVRTNGEVRSWAVAEAILLNITAEGSGGAYRGRILRSAAITGTGAGTGRNLGVTTAGQIFAATYRVVSVSGVGSITLRIQESTDDAAGDPYADITGM